MSSLKHLALQAFYLALTTLVVHVAGDACAGVTLPEHCLCQDTLDASYAIECRNLMDGKFPLLQGLHPKKIQFISCKFPTIGGVDNSFPAGYGNVEFLQITNSEVQLIHDNAFSDLLNMNQLDLSSNFISNLSSNLFMDNPLLEQLDLGRNRLSSLPENIFTPTMNLRTIYLDDNSISSLPDQLFNKTKVTDIELSNNKLTAIPQAVRNIPNLDILQLSGNNFGDLAADTFRDFSSLKVLDLRSCGISKIDDNAFAGLTQIQELSLDSNELTEITVRTLTPMHKSLIKIWLNNNQLQTLANGTLPLGGVLTNLKLGHNPWRCDKNIAWFKDLNLPKIDHENVTCNSPPKFTGMSINNITKAELEKEDGGRRTMIAAAIALPIIAICLVIIVLIIYKIIQSRRQQKRASFRYSAVYRDTVESAHQPYRRPVSEI